MSSVQASRSATKRLLKELDTWRSEQKDERGVERLGPAGEDDLFVWEAVINGQGIGCGYDGVLILLSFPIIRHQC
jgi:peroxin-4